ncbi:MAG: hypothetical protein Rubg2KO_01080 [Rubricoccaceae bacterium]
MSRLACVLVVLLLAPPALAQSAAQARGDSLKLAGNLVGAVQAYTAALDQGEEVAFELASTYALHPQFADSAFHYLTLALDTEDSMRPLWHSDFALLANDDRWTQIEATQLDKLEAQVAGPFNREYARQLLRMRVHEWAYRYPIMLAFRQLGPNSPIVTALSTAMSANHDDNLLALAPLIEEHGWPELSAVGEEAAYAAGNVINHSDLATRQRYLPLLKAVCERGEGDWSRYAHIYDRTELEKGNPQLYGTQMQQNPETGRYEPQPLVDPETVDERRAALLMEPLADQLQRFNENMARDFGSANN